MALKIISAEERLKEKRGHKIVIVVQVVWVRQLLLVLLIQIQHYLWT